MKIGAVTEPRTAISGSNPETIIVRGRDLATDLVGSLTFTEHVWLLVAGDPPSEPQRRMLDACLVAIAEHGLVPSVAAARMTLAAAPEALQGAVAAGLLGCGSVILGSSQAAGEFLHGVVEEASGNDPSSAARDAVQALRARKAAVPGYGHPLHKGGDPRAHRLFALAKELDVGGAHIHAALAVEAVLPEVTGRDLRMNISSAIPAVLLDVGFPIGALKGVPLLARTASLIAHLLEEQLRPIGFAMAHAAAAVVIYDGLAPDGFVADDN
ncbi:citryl-CoA lyase [uncultured Sphingomonas sp.]|uniref:citryl-CoA lyase n=1 Tax=uncultured Sphingomonas sp. TaxID=158754 RepID=UPI0035CAF76E